MAKLNALKKKAAVTKYSEAYKTNPDAAIAEMQAAEFSEEHITEIIDAIEGAEPVKAPKAEKPKAPEKTGLNPVFEKHTVRVSYQTDPDTNQLVKDKFGRNIPIFTKVEYLRDCKISIEQADLLNSQSQNTLIRYYEKK